MDRPALVGLDLLVVAVDRLAEQVEDSPERPLTHGHGDGSAGVVDGRAAREAVGGVHRHRAHAVVTKVLLNLEHEPALARLHLLVLGLLHVELDLERVVDLRQVIRRERHLDDHPLHLLHAAEVRVVALFGVGALGGLGLGARFQGELLLPGWGPRGGEDEGAEATGRACAAPDSISALAAYPMRSGAEPSEKPRALALTV